MLRDFDKLAETEITAKFVTIYNTKRESKYKYEKKEKKRCI